MAVGYVVHTLAMKGKAEAATTAGGSLSLNSTILVGWGDTVHHSLDDEGKPRIYWEIERRCITRHGVAHNPLSLTTGTPSTRWATPETVGPMSAVLHHVYTREAWRRVRALAAHWTAQVRRRGRPECFFPQRVVGRV